MKAKREFSLITVMDNNWLALKALIFAYLYTYILFLFDFFPVFDNCILIF